jgi:hypothetical protein
LVTERYGWRGYQTVNLPTDQTSHRVTLTANENGKTIGTITIGMDGPEGMACEDAFKEEIAELRADGARICEFTKLAIDPECGSHHVLAGLFHTAFVVAHLMRGYDGLVLEVNPRHVRFYERVIGAHVLGRERTNRFVNAPAVLLGMSFAEVRQRIAEARQSGPDALGAHSLYAFAFSDREEAGILARLMSAQEPASPAHH